MVDTKGLTKDLEGKKLRLYFHGGEVCDAKLLLVDVHENCPFGDDYADFIYDVISTNQPGKYDGHDSKEPSSVYSAEFGHLERWEILE
jgi:hypothetical protein